MRASFFNYSTSPSYWHPYKSSNFQYLSGESSVSIVLIHIYFFLNNVSITFLMYLVSNKFCLIFCNKCLIFSNVHIYCPMVIPSFGVFFRLLSNAISLTLLHKSAKGEHFSIDSESRLARDSIVRE